MHTQFRSILHDLKSFDYDKKNISTASIKLCLVYNFSHWPDRIKGRKICCLFQTLTGKSFKFVCRNIVTLSFQKCKELVFLHQIVSSLILDWFLWSHTIHLFIKNVHKKNSAIFLVFSVKYSKFCSLKPMARHIQFLSHFHDLKSFDYDKNVPAFFTPNCHL